MKHSVPLPAPLLSLWSLLLALLFVPPPSPAGERGPYVLAVLPQQPPVAMSTAWQPFVERLARETGLALKLKVYDQMLDFESDLRQGMADFVFANPTQTVLARRAQQYIPLVRSSRTLAGILFVPKDSPARTLSDLEGQDIAFVGEKNL